MCFGCALPHAACCFREPWSLEYLFIATCDLFIDDDPYADHIAEHEAHVDTMLHVTPKLPPREALALPSASALPAGVDDESQPPPPVPRRVSQALLPDDGGVPPRTTADCPVGFVFDQQLPVVIKYHDNDEKDDNDFAADTTQTHQ